MCTVTLVACTRFYFHASVLLSVELCEVKSTVLGDKTRISGTLAVCDLYKCDSIQWDSS